MTHSLPQLAGERVFLTDGGLETTLVFHRGIDLPAFAAFPLLERANASDKSHAELDEATELDEGDPSALAAGYVALRPRLRNVTVLGGCCGTDERHVAAVAAAWTR